MATLPRGANGSSSRKPIPSTRLHSVKNQNERERKERKRWRDNVDVTITDADRERWLVGWCVGGGGCMCCVCVVMVERVKQYKIIPLCFPQLSHKRIERIAHSEIILSTKTIMPF